MRHTSALKSLKSLKNLHSFRAWQREALQSSGLLSVFGLFPLLTAAFVIASGRLRHSPSHVLLLFAAYLAATGALMVFGALRWTMWRRTHPWAPPVEQPAVPAWSRL